MPGAPSRGHPTPVAGVKAESQAGVKLKAMYRKAASRHISIPDLTPLTRFRVIGYERRRCSWGVAIDQNRIVRLPSIVLSS